MYDVASALDYEGMYLPKLKMAMKIGKHDVFVTVKGRHWRAFAVANRLDPDQVVSDVDYIAARLPAAFALAMDDDAVRELQSPLPTSLLDLLTARSEQCRRDLRH